MRGSTHSKNAQWGVSAGRTWELLEGLEEGQTQLTAAADGDMIVWAHPLDLHYACKGLTGWPKLHFQIWSQDAHGRNDICGYHENCRIYALIKV